MRKRRLLEVDFMRQGYYYEQVQRNNYSALYAQKLGSKIIAYEAIKIRIAKAGLAFGKWQEEREIYPSSESWGSLAFTIPSNQLERAIDIYEKISEAEKERLSLDVSQKRRDNAKQVESIKELVTV